MRTRTLAQRRIPWRVREALDGYIMTLPWIVGFVFLTAGPFVASLGLSLTNWDMLTDARWMGLANYAKLFGDKYVRISAYNTLYYTAFLVPSQVILALLLSLALNINLRGIRLYRTLYYLPSITPAVASAMLWMLIFQPDFGLANWLLSRVGLPKLLWLLDPKLAKPALIIMSLSGVGGGTPIMLAGLQGIPVELYEAAKIDGANRWYQFWRITLPLMTPVLFFSTVTGIIGSFQVFTASYIATGGGPQNSTLFYVLLLYRQAFENFRMGYSCAMAWILFVVLLIFTLFQFWLGQKWVYYEA
jgi:multiple sugar transport system permease protein